MSAIIRKKHNSNDIFEIVKVLGEGGFGKVYEVEDKNNGQRFAIKAINIENTCKVSELLTEALKLKNCSKDFVVQYIDSWVENDCHYIQMELCSDSLDNIITSKRSYFGRHSGLEQMDIKEYFISSQLFKELLECVKYLHESNPSIIHRDLKPENILIKENFEKGRFLKICDLGQAKYGGPTTRSHTRGQGTFYYMAPEVNTGIYNQKVDIYSLGAIATKLFDFNTNGIRDMNINNKLKTKWMNLEALIFSMMKPQYSERPSCSKVLAKAYHWTLNTIELAEKMEPLVSQIYQGDDDNFFRKYHNQQLLKILLFDLKNLDNPKGLPKESLGEFIDKWEFSIQNSNVNIAIANETDRNWRLWIGDNITSNCDNMFTLNPYCTPFVHVFQEWNTWYKKSNHWARIYSENEPKKYAAWFVFARGAPRENNFYIIRDYNIFRIVPETKEEEKITDICRFTSIEEADVREIKWLIEDWETTNRHWLWRWFTSRVI